MSGRRIHPSLIQRAILLGAAIALLTIGIVLGVRLYERSRETPSLEDYLPEGQIEINGQRYRRKRYLKTYLVMGIDKDSVDVRLGSTNPEQTDFNALVVVNLEERTYTVLFINRDTMTDVQQLALDGTPFYVQREQLALAHTYGSGGADSCRNTADAVSKLFYGAPVDHYLAFYLDSIGILNDAVGGVPVLIEDDFSHVDESLVQGAIVKLNAAQAEHFVRGRGGVADQTNINRMARQQAYLTSWRNQALLAIRDNSSFFTELVTELGDQLVTDLSLQQVSDVLKYIDLFQEGNSHALAGTSQRGEEFMEFYVDDEALLQTVLELFFDPVK